MVVNSTTDKVDKEVVVKSSIVKTKIHGLMNQDYKSIQARKKDYMYLQADYLKDKRGVVLNFLDNPITHNVLP